MNVFDFRKIASQEEMRIEGSRLRDFLDKMKRDAYLLKSKTLLSRFAERLGS